MRLFRKGERLLDLGMISVVGLVLMAERFARVVIFLLESVSLDFLVSHIWNHAFVYCQALPKKVRSTHR
ncbi:MAG: hypothetical protein H6998_20850 [Hahellaceae bacterium]|nr:hypothetical protein [Hahellaceae bacterium]